MQRQLTVEDVRQERLRLSMAISNLENKQSAAKRLADLLVSQEPAATEILKAMGGYYGAESSALAHDVAALREQMGQLDALEAQVRMQASGLVVAVPGARRT